MSALYNRLFLSLLVGAFLLASSACGGDDTAGGEGTQSAADVSSEASSEDAGSSAASSSSMSTDAEASPEDVAPAVAPTEAELAAACTAYCVFDNETCPDPSQDAVNDTAACEVECLDAANPAGLSAAAAKSPACYAQTSTYFGCLAELSCEGYDAHLEGLQTPDYVDDCTLLLADEACS